jgi:hypothetical protein
LEWNTSYDLSSVGEWIGNFGGDLPKLSDILKTIEDNELISKNEDLDDLPDSDGVLQIGLSWNTNETDIDLWVVDPNGEKIFWNNPNATSGGYLDRDDIDGFGPENIYWYSDFPEGKYEVYVDYYGCFPSCPSTDFVVKISNGLSNIETINGSITESDTKLVGEFTIQNKAIVFW